MALIDRLHRLEIKASARQPEERQEVTLADFVRVEPDPMVFAGKVTAFLTEAVEGGDGSAYAAIQDLKQRALEARVVCRQ